MESKITILGKEGLQSLYDNNNSYVEILTKIGLTPKGGGSRRTIKKLDKKRIICYN